MNKKVYIQPQIFYCSTTDRKFAGKPGRRPGQKVNTGWRYVWRIGHYRNRAAQVERMIGLQGAL